ncbi:MAG: SpoIIE family protein phosphatase [Lachnospiraceae bacterium]|nr:SpoIIE family protein phosphatase [Lachnospiraceae bacterium]
MKKTIFRVLLLVTSISLLVFGGILIWQLLSLRSRLGNISEQASKRIREISETAISEQVSERLYENSRANANEADHVFSDLSHAVSLIAESAEEIYKEPARYGKASVAEPDPSMIGKELVAQVVYAKDADPGTAALQEELGMIGNLQGMLHSLYGQFPQLASAYIATDTGIMVMVEPVSENRFDEAGNVLPFEAKSRPWYIGAAQSKQTYFTGVVQDADNGGYGLICAVPVLKDDQVVAVVGAGMMLDAVEALVSNADLGEEGISCIVNDHGSIIFSTSDEGSLKTDGGNGSDIRTLGNEELSNLIDEALAGKSGVAQLSLDGQSSYIAYVPMDTVAWTFLSVMPEEAVLAPTVALVDTLDESNSERNEELNRSVRFTFSILIVDVILVIIVVMVLSQFFSIRLVKPIQILTERVKGLEGDDLEFTWELQTKDEIQTLAESFSSMTERMKNYIINIREVTAEKERIGAELNVATQIQADMLPCIFPAFPDRPEFDVYATMTPAKEVGGDFYDFFLIDEDHLGLVMADVSGKGVPAALFMVIAKTLIKNRALIGGTPAEVLAYANEQLCEGNKADLFVTVWFAIIEISTGKGMAANAGHEHPALRRADGSFELIKYRHSPAVAVMEGLLFQEREFELHPGDTLYVYTDGVTEATNANNELFGEDRLVDALNRDPKAEPKEILAIVKEEIDAFVAEAPQFDDITMLGMTYYGKK